MKKALKLLKEHLKELKREKRMFCPTVELRIKKIIEITEVEMCIEAIQDLLKARRV
ncbi:hypothetical protein [Pontibacter qinzhouensis]|uniref:hypothetical protein n=1 Tax=Pontibacter qinzhouensis TaxID=2603253 RepID=UPI00164F38CA|nr:hypothetical protein [Pontibacter qinzhouensis]